MIRRSKVEIVDFTEYDEKISYCKDCLKYGIHSILGNRVYPDNQIATDHENWLQCYSCGSVFSVNEVSREPAIKDVVETTTNPFDLAQDQFLGIDRRTSVNGRKRKMKRDRQKELDEIKEPDLKAELAKGSTLLNYFEQMPQ